MKFICYMYIVLFPNYIQSKMTVHKYWNSLCQGSYFTFPSRMLWTYEDVTQDCCKIWLQGHKSETVSLLISISLSEKEYIEEKWDWDQKWDRLSFMAPGPDVHLKTFHLFNFNFYSRALQVSSFGSNFTILKQLESEKVKIALIFLPWTSGLNSCLFELLIAWSVGLLHRIGSVSVI